MSMIRSTSYTSSSSSCSLSAGSALSASAMAERRGPGYWACFGGSLGLGSGAREGRVPLAHLARLERKCPMFPKGNTDKELPLKHGGVHTALRTDAP
ncbi:hypothetical protein EYF80_059294 [Liparis tanakae]|uniref:Uncharacterized protein n=1 Tax=Liparis tanakae TaxID=230148 RepID=A0A4Z2EP31_9TELE|nr:hypothetical protein EYF80_059294 [Liparis tanakae]